MPYKRQTLVSLCNSRRMANVMSAVHSLIVNELASKPTYFKQTFFNSGTNKYFIKGDELAEDAFRRQMRSIQDATGGNIVVYAEDTLPREALNLASSTDLCVLCDIIDGTDLLVRGFSNWCSAAVVFLPEERSIASAFVYVKGQDLDTFYFSNIDSVRQNKPPLIYTYRTETKVRSDRSIAEKILNEELNAGQLTPKHTLAEATICCYGQKFQALNENFQFLQSARSRRFFTSVSAARFYNLAGNPMMCRMIDADPPVDLVFDIRGQWPHDVVPGAFIALSAGAAMYDLGNEPKRPDRRVSFEDLIDFLIAPNVVARKMKYVIGNSESICDEFLKLYFRT